MESKNFSRHVAIKTTIGVLNNSTYIQEKDSLPNYLLDEKGEKMFRINVLAIVLNIEKTGSITNIFIDDGSGNIVMRSFEENKQINNLNIGDSILIIGRLRIYNEDKYISPEIIKVVDSLWLKVRALELKNNFKNKVEIIKTTENLENEKEELTISYPKTNKKNKLQETVSLSKNKEEEIIIEEPFEVSDQKEEVLIKNDDSTKENEDILLPTEKILQLISSLDKGEGAGIEEIIEKSPLENIEKLLEKMMERGDIFQIMPGKVKVL